MAAVSTAVPIVARALFIAPVVDTGQLSRFEISALRSAVRRGYLATAKAGPFPERKDVYARPDFDFRQDRFESMVEYRIALSIAAIRRERSS